jgi:Holliday junction resolvasome RuvABC DNA-binding subunit
LFDEENQTTFEGIMYQAMSLFNNGGASKSKIIEAHKRFVADIQYKQEEKLSRTQELNTAKVEALKELGYTEINEANAAEVFEKIAEIQSRKIS